MFLSELSPIFQELIQQPIAFAGGFFSGVLRLNVSDEPLSSWLAKQGYIHTDTDDNEKNGSDRPQSISIE
jgi:hypothetical protein